MCPLQAAEVLSAQSGKCADYQRLSAFPNPWAAMRNFAATASRGCCSTFHMKTPLLLPIVAALLCAASSPAQESDKARPEAQEKMEKAKRRIEELHAAGKHDDAVRLEQRLHEETACQGEQPERLRHMAEAIKHLRAAGLNEAAERIEQMVREQQKQQKPEGREKAAQREGEQLQRAMREMHEEMQRALRDTHDQMAKMAHTIDELREQVGRRKDQN